MYHNLSVYNFNVLTLHVKVFLQNIIRCQRVKMQHLAEIWDGSGPILVFFKRLVQIHHD